ncbi:MAG: DUF4912 domain-containing protein [Chthoniobacterales bacterium]
MKKSKKSDAKKPKAKAKPAAAKSKTATKRRTTKKVAEDVHKFEATKPTRARKPAARTRAKKSAGADIDNLGDLPRSYGDENIFVIAQEPHWLFCYWDYTLTEGIEGAVFLRHGRIGAERPEAEVPVPAETNSWYLSVRDADADYYVELGHYNGGHWKTLTRSGTVLTPRDTLAGFGEPVFANMPFHATFQQLVEKLRGEMHEGESLAEALSRLQGRGDFPIGRLSPAQRIALDRLLDTELGSLTSGELARYLGSPGASLFSGGFAPTSWGAAAASWAQAPGGFSSGFLAALGLAGASWSGASFEQALGSWSSAALASWGAQSSFLSSWSRPRGFFMHLNAEVIFYGGTHPDAKVTVDGKEIMIRPDGTFRYHFVLPDGEFEIPIVATSPDGVETRRAVLRFERATAREGEVGATAQPPLGEPMGRQS